MDPACEGPNGVRASCVTWARGREGCVGEGGLDLEAESVRLDLFQKKKMQGRIHLWLALKKEEEGRREGREGGREEERLKCISFMWRDMHITQRLGRETRFILKKPTTFGQGTPPTLYLSGNKAMSSVGSVRVQCQRRVNAGRCHTPSGTNGRVHTAETTKSSSRYTVIQTHCLHTHTHLRAVYNLLTRDMSCKYVSSI